jgi:hypothetical protein
VNIRLSTVIDSAPGAREYFSLLTTLTTDVKSPAVKALLTIPASVFYLVVRLRRAGASSLSKTPIISLFFSVGPGKFIHSPPRMSAKEGIVSFS